VSKTEVQSPSSQEGSEQQSVETDQAAVDQCASHAAWHSSVPASDQMIEKAAGNIDHGRYSEQEMLDNSLALTMNGLGPTGPDKKPKLRGWARIEAAFEHLTHTNRFFQKIGSRIWLPLAFHSGLTMKKLDPHTFTYVLPFRRFNRNWYNAMAGGALLANSEIAAGMYLCTELGGLWTIVCRNLNYRFLRPCFGPAVYKVDPISELNSHLLAGREFNLDMTMEILQQVKKSGKQPRVGRCELTFHCTPKDKHGNKKMRKRARNARKARKEQASD